MVDRAKLLSMILSAATVGVALSILVPANVAIFPAVALWGVSAAWVCAREVMK